MIVLLVSTMCSDNVISKKGRKHRSKRITRKSSSGKFPCTPGVMPLAVAKPCTYGETRNARAELLVYVWILPSSRINTARKVVGINWALQENVSIRNAKKYDTIFGNDSMYRVR